MHIPTLIRRLTLPIGALLLIAACSSGGQAGWTYAPLGPSANPSEAPSGAPASGAPGSPSGSAGAGTAISVQTTSAAPLKFDPADLTVSAGATVNVTYTNDSNLPHNIHFFDGKDSTGASLGASTVATGPGAAETVTFTAPTTPGDYYFWCDVHQASMSGTFHVQ